MYSVETRGFMESGKNDLNKQGVHMKTKELRYKARKYEKPRKILKFKAYNLIMNSRIVSTGRYGTVSWTAVRVRSVRGLHFDAKISSIWYVVRIKIQVSEISEGFFDNCF